MFLSAWVVAVTDGEKVISLAKQIYKVGYEAGVHATNVDCGVVWEERIDAIKAEIEEQLNFEPQRRLDEEYQYGLTVALHIISKHCGGDNE